MQTQVLEEPPNVLYETHSKKRNRIELESSDSISQENSASLSDTALRYNHPFASPSNFNISLHYNDSLEKFNSK